MPILEYIFKFGVKTAGDLLSATTGFARNMINMVYDRDDADRPQKIWGRTLAIDLVSGPDTNAKDIEYLYFNTTPKMLLLANGQLYEGDAGDTVGTLASVNDLADTPAAYARTGSSLHSIPDGLRRHIVWDGASGARPMIRDEEDNWRYLGLKKPLSGSMVAAAQAPTFLRPVTSTEPTGTLDTDIGTPSGGFDDPEKVYDIDDLTSASKIAYEESLWATDWTFDPGTLGEAYKLNITVDHQLNVIDPTGDQYFYKGGAFSGGGGVTGTPPPRPVVARLVLQVSLTGIEGNENANFETVRTYPIPFGRDTPQVDLPNGQDMSLVSVRALFSYFSGTAGAAAFVSEIWAQEADAGSSTLLPVGKYFYTQTEFFQITLATGDIISVESAPSDLVFIEGDGSTVFGAILTLGAAQNDGSDGIKHDEANGIIHTKRIYRSTSTGSYPNLGYVGSAAYDATTWVDSFNPVGPTALGFPGIAVHRVGDAIYSLAEQPPAFRDVTQWRGSIVAIPEATPERIQWSPFFQPDYWPSSQSFLPVSDGRSDENLGVVTLNEKIVIFSRTRVKRISYLPTSADPGFTLDRVEWDILSPSEGMVPSRQAYCTLHSQKGHPVVAWISDTGIWMTDGTLLSERGLGIVLLTAHIAWEHDVDVARLDEAELAFDSRIQAIFFDFYDPDGDRKTFILHTAPHHWIPTGEDQSVPKITGPHTLTAHGRAIGDYSSQIRHWVLDTDALRIVNERTGTDNVGSDILSNIEGHWTYPAGETQSYHLRNGHLRHSDWGAGESAEVFLQMRKDESGTTQSARKAVRLRGEASTSVGLINRAGRSFKASFKHDGKTRSDQTVMKALGPLHIRFDVKGYARED